MKTKKTKRLKTNSPQKSFPENLVLVLFVVFCFLLITYIYNESKQPVYRATSKVSVTLNQEKAKNISHQMNFYSYQVRLQEIIDKLTSEPVLKKLAQTETLQNIFNAEKNIYPDISNSAPVERLKKSIKININPDNSTLQITVSDTNPELASTVANLLPKQLVSPARTEDTDIKNQLSRINKEINATITDFKTTKTLQTGTKETTKSTDDLKQDLKTITERQNQINNQIMEITNMASGQQVSVSDNIENKKIAMLNRYLIAKEVELQAAKQHSRYPKALLSEVSFARGKLIIEIQNTLKNLYAESRDLEKQKHTLEEDLSISGNITPKTTDTTPPADEQLFKKILGQDRLDEFYASETLVLTEAAATPKFPQSPDKYKNLLMALISGILTSLILAVIIKKIRATINSSKDISDGLQLKVLGSIDHHSLQ